jgi:hypothetical protein
MEKSTVIPVVLQKRVIVHDGLVFDAERELHLPVPPCVGMLLYNTEWRPPDCGESEDRVEQIGFDAATGKVYCYLPLNDFRPEFSGSDGWTEEDARDRYQDWTLTRDVHC